MSLFVFKLPDWAAPKGRPYVVSTGFDVLGFGASVDEAMAQYRKYSAQRFAHENVSEGRNHATA